MRRLLLSLGWGTLGSLLVVALLRASSAKVLASRLGEPSAGEMSAIAAQSVSDWRTVMLDTYDGTFDDVQREITTTGTTDYGWGRVVTNTTSFTDTMWCMGGGDGISLTAGVDSYVDGMTTTLVYGPISFRNVLTAELQFAHWISVAGGDGLEWGTSVDGNPFVYTPVTPASMGQWYTTTLNSDVSGELGDLPGTHRVYLAFRFHSDSSGADLGAFLDNVRLRTRHDTTTFFPLIIKRDFDPYTYEDDFQDTGSGWPVGSKITWNSDGTVSEQFEYGYRTDSDTSKVYRIFVRDDGDHVFLTGPARTLEDFEFRTHVRRGTAATPPVWGDEYGVLLSPTEIDPQYPVGESIYTFQIRLYVGGQEPRWVVKKWTLEDSHHRDGDELDSAEYMRYEILAIGPAAKNLTDQNKVWNYLEIRRNGQTLEFWLTDQAHPADWQHVFSHTDAELPAQLYIGFYAAHTKYSYDMVFQYDNVYLNAHP